MNTSEEELQYLEFHASVVLFFVFIIPFCLVGTYQLCYSIHQLTQDLFEV